MVEARPAPLDRPLDAVEPVAVKKETVDVATTDVEQDAEQECGAQVDCVDQVGTAEGELGQ